MKSLLVLALLLSTSAFGSQIDPISAVLPTVLKGTKVTGLTGVANVDLVDNVLQVRLFDDPCNSLLPAKPGEVRCKAMPRLVNTYTVPVQDTADDCGSVVYSGKKDFRRVDGGVIAITYTDNSLRTCENVILGTVVVEVVIQGRGKKRPTVYTLYN